MADPSGERVVTTEVEEQAIAARYAMTASTVFQTLCLCIKTTCPRGLANCGLTWIPDELPLHGEQRSALEAERGQPVGRFVTYTDVFCMAVEECSDPSKVQDLADDLRRAAGQLPSSKN